MIGIMASLHGWEKKTPARPDRLREELRERLYAVGLITYSAPVDRVSGPAPLRPEATGLGNCRLRIVDFRMGQGSAVAADAYRVALSFQIHESKIPNLTSSIDNSPITNRQSPIVNPQS